MTVTNLKKMAVISIAFCQILGMNNSMAQTNENNMQLDLLLQNINEMSYGCTGMDDQFACAEIESIKSIIRKIIDNSNDVSNEDSYELTRLFDELSYRRLDNASIVGQIKNRLFENKEIILRAVHDIIYKRY